EPLRRSVPAAGVGRRDDDAAAAERTLEVLGSDDRRCRFLRLRAIDGERFRETMRVRDEGPRDIEALHDTPASSEQAAVAFEDALSLGGQCARERHAKEGRAVLHPESWPVAGPGIGQPAELDTADDHLRAASFRRMASLSTVPSPASAFP